MPPIRIPNTGKIIFVNNHIGDTVIDYSEYPEFDDSIKNEDVRIVGDWEDFSGSGTIGPHEVMYQGIQDIPPGTLQGQLDLSDPERTNRGKLASTRRQRPKLVHIEL